jgi:hypothetical protein
VRQRIGYLHVPKAAGSSVTDAIRRAVLATAEREHRAISICPEVMDRTLYGGFDRYDEMSGKPRQMIFTGSTDRLSQYDVVVGHFAAASLRPGRDGDDLAVLFREPRARLMSHYAYWVGWPAAEHAAWDPYDGSRRAAASSWAEFVSDEQLASQIDNVATRLLLAPHPLIPADGFIDERDHDTLIGHARAALTTVGFVDAIEHGERCWRRLGEWAGLDLEVGHRNVTERDAVDPPRWSAAETPAATRALALRTAIDRELWLVAMGDDDPGEAVAEGDRIAVEQLRSVTAWTTPTGDRWHVDTRIDRPLASGPIARIRRRLVRARRRVARAWRRVAHRRDR